MEASSHGLEQRRLDGVRLAAAGFTNLGRDHMDYHPTMDDYFAAKMRLFDTLMHKSTPAVIFADDAWSAPAVEASRKAGLDVLTVGRAGESPNGRDFGDGTRGRSDVAQGGPGDNRGNNGFGNGGHDGSNAGKQDATR